VFNNQATREVLLELGTSLTVGKLTVAANFAKDFTVEGHLTVHMGSVTGDSTWASEKYLKLLERGDFEIKGAGRFIFSDGGVTFGELELGETFVKSGATLRLTDGADRLITKLEVGDGSSAGTVELVDLTGNVAGGADVVVTPTGTFKMLQTGDLQNEAKGSFVAASATASFTNQGTFIRSGTTTGAYAPQLDYIVSNTGTFSVEWFSTIHLTKQNADHYSLINQSGGTIDLYWGAVVRGSAGAKFKQEGGIFQTRSNLEAGPSVSTFLLKSEFLGGSVRVGDLFGYSKLDFGNNDVKFANSTFIYLDVDGASAVGSEKGDQIVVSGASQITIDNTGATKPTLVIDTDHAIPAGNWQFDVMTAPNLVGSFDPNNITFTGFVPPGGYTVSYPAGPPRSVRLKK
jgi:hypothetical protein